MHSLNVFAIMPSLLKLERYAFPSKGSYFIIFICGLFNDALSSSDYIASKDRMINE
jgi:hypothetical protein